LFGHFLLLVEIASKIGIKASNLFNIFNLVNPVLIKLSVKLQFNIFAYSFEDLTKKDVKSFISLILSSFNF